jgi:hypothetical protein
MNDSLRQRITAVIYPMLPGSYNQAAAEHIADDTN